MSDEQMQPTFTMSHSPTIGAIAAAMAKAQAVMGPAIKDSQNPHFRNDYASLASCFEACRPLHNNEIAITQIPLDGGDGGVLISTMLIHSSGEWIRGNLWLPVSKADAQGYGSALTYARRYCLQALTGLAPDDDDGNEAVNGGPKPAQRPPQAPPQRGPAKAGAAPANLGLFADICEALDRAEAPARVNEIVVNTQRAHQQGLITDAHLEQIKASVAKKRAGFANANGGAS